MFFGGVVQSLNAAHPSKAVVEALLPGRCGPSLRLRRDFAGMFAVIPIGAQLWQ